MSLLSIAVLISGQGTNLQALIEAIERGKLSAEIVVVISNNPDAIGLRWARQAGIDVVVVDHRIAMSRQDYDRQLVEALAPYVVDYVVLAGFMRKLTPFFVRAFKNRILNIHPSLLPRYPGLRTHERVLAAGNAQHGCSVHYVIDALDAGPVIASAKFEVLPTDTAKTLQQRVHVLEYELYWRVLELIRLGSVVLRDGEVYVGGEKVLETGLFLPFGL